MVNCNNSHVIETTQCEPINVVSPVKKTLKNSVDPDRTSQNATSDQELYCLHTRISVKKYNK